MENSALNFSIKETHETTLEFDEEVKIDNKSHNC